jgi:hypothetical protein
MDRAADDHAGIGGDTMCMMLYLAADVPLTELQWDEESGSIGVALVDAESEVVRRQFSRPHVYHLSAKLACSCDFQYSPGAAFASERAAVAQLSAYLTDVLTRVPSVELFSCWAGDETADEVTREHVTVEALFSGGDQFRFEERWLGVVSRGAPS